MRRRNLPKTETKKTIRRERDPIPWRYCFVTLVCGVILVGGFFFAARQHFSAMDFSIKNAQLRRQKEELEAEQRRFVLAKEVALSPSEIKKAARKIGFQDMSAANIQIFTASEPENPAQVEKTSDKSVEKSVEKPIEKNAEKTVETVKPKDVKVQETVVKSGSQVSPEKEKKATPKPTTVTEKKPEKKEKKTETAKTEKRLGKNGESGM